MRDADGFPARWFHGEQRHPTIEHGFARGDMAGDLGMFVLPPFQRPFVWTEAQCVRFIESMWLGLPLAAYVYNDGLENRGLAYDRWLLDGQQRWTAILRYAAGDYHVFGKLFPDLTVERQRRFRMGIVFPCYVTKLGDEAKLREIYNRLAYGGTPHA